VNLEVGLKPDLTIQIKIHVFHAQITGNPRAIDDERHRSFIQLFEARGFLKNFPLFGSHTISLAQRRDNVRDIAIILLSDFEPLTNELAARRRFCEAG
jgi:hypothetical protein